MTRSCPIFILAFICVFLAHANAEQPHLATNGNSFLLVCNDAVDKPASTNPVEAFHTGMCIGFITGLDEGLTLITAVRNEPLPYCQPSEVTTAQLLRIVLKYIKDHPEIAHQRTELLALKA